MPAAVNSLNRPVCSASDILSRSLTARLITSPVLWLSKYTRGRRFIFSLISVRSLRLNRSAKLDMRKLCRV